MSLNKNVLFKYVYGGVEFSVIAQPIVENRTKKISAFELLSRNIFINCTESFFGNISADDVTKISCIQMNEISKIINHRCGSYDWRVHINIHHRTLFNAEFIDLASKIQRFKFAFEINGFEYQKDKLAKIRGAFKKIKSFGHELWLDDYGVNNATTGLLLNLPWDGVKIDKEIVWGSTHKQLCSIVSACKSCTGKVTLEGVENEYLNDLSIYTGSDFSQGFNWSLLNKDLSAAMHSSVSLDIS